MAKDSTHGLDLTGIGSASTVWVCRGERRPATTPSCVAALFFTLIASGCATGVAPVGRGGSAPHLPGHESNSLDDLAPDFRRRVDNVLAALIAQGLAARVVTTYRNLVRQEALFWSAEPGRLLDGRKTTGARAGESCHNRTNLFGFPAARAVDLSPQNARDDVERAAFYRALGAAAHAAGLRWGGDFARSSPRWRRHGLGWDPGHVEDPDCTARR